LAVTTTTTIANQHNNKNMDLKLPALATSALVVLMMIIGLATPLWVGTVSSYDVTYYIRDYVAEASGTSTTTNIWEFDCTNDDCKSGVSQLKAGFAFVFMGMLANLAVIACLVAANGFVVIVPLPAPAGEKMVTTGAAAVAAFLYFLGVIMAVNGYPASDKTFTDLHDISVGSIFLILGLFAAVAVPIMCFVGLEDGDASSEAAAPGAAAAAMEAKEMPNTAAVKAPPAADVEAPPAADVEAPPASSAE